MLVPFVNNLIVLDQEGNRIFAKYYDGKSKVDQVALEALLHKKTKAVAAKNEAEVLLMDNDIFVYKSGIECKFYVSGAVEEVRILHIRSRSCPITFLPHIRMSLY